MQPKGWSTWSCCRIILQIGRRTVLYQKADPLGWLVGWWVDGLASFSIKNELPTKEQSILAQRAVARVHDKQFSAQVRRGLPVDRFQSKALLKGLPQQFFEFGLVQKRRWLLDNPKRKFSFPEIFYANAHAPEVAGIKIHPFEDLSWPPDASLERSPRTKPKNNEPFSKFNYQRRFRRGKWVRRHDGALEAIASTATSRLHSGAAAKVR